MKMIIKQKINQVMKKMKENKSHLTKRKMRR